MPYRGVPAIANPHPTNNPPLYRINTTVHHRLCLKRTSFRSPLTGGDLHWRVPFIEIPVQCVVQPISNPLNPKLAPTNLLIHNHFSHLTTMNNPIAFYTSLLASFACLVLLALTAFLGLSYVYQGHGLHHYIAIAVCTVCAALAYFFAHQAQKFEEDLT